MDIVIRAAAIFVFLWLVTRVAGRSTLGELSSFELILFVTMGDFVAQGVIGQDYSSTAAVLAVSTVAILTVAVSLVNSRSRRAARLTHGVPVVVVSGGDPLLEVMRRERLGLDDLLSAARGQGIELISTIQLAVLETNGQLSFFTASDGESGASPPPPVG
ncbi:DUF421 domain-containing protein [Ornithinimicrobium faecis]|uniref:DUF421 domain-containing protein n=1 Tax=Ornithinimicrobium faecis TaxID=2934158 RepID=A0ABY4YNQ8_9MICO|nr:MULTISPECIES: YetF domain-containing protein [unclassified Ornithinimicrobium]USQ78415.1 DUF421 domain-containing protein [Ornithinimicrobium sp. HY1793]